MPGKWISLREKIMFQDTVKPLQKSLLDYTAVLFTLDLYQYYSFKQTLGDVQRYQTPELPHWLFSTYWQPVYESLLCRDIFCGRCKIRTYGTFTGPGVFKTPGINQLSQPSKKNAVSIFNWIYKHANIDFIQYVIDGFIWISSNAETCKFTDRRLHFFLSLLLELNQYLLITNQL